MGFIREMLCCLIVVCIAAVLQLTPLCIQILSVRIDYLEPLPETTTIDASSIGIVQVSSRPCRVKWDITFWVHSIAGRGLMGEECAFLQSQPQWNMSKQPQAADLLGCITGRM